MSTERERREVYSRPRWKRLRQLVMLDAGYLCARCLEKDRTGPAEIVHHIRPLKQGGDPWARSNLEAVCRKCHEARHRAVDSTIPIELREWRALIGSILNPNDEVLLS